MAVEKRIRSSQRQRGRDPVKSVTYARGTHETKQGGVYQRPTHVEDNQIHTSYHTTPQNRPEPLLASCLPPPPPKKGYSRRRRRGPHLPGRGNGAARQRLPHHADPGASLDRLGGAGGGGGEAGGGVPLGGRRVRCGAVLDEGRERPPQRDRTKVKRRGVFSLQCFAGVGCELSGFCERCLRCGSCRRSLVGVIVEKETLTKALRG